MNLKHGETDVIDLQAQEAKQSTASVAGDQARFRTLIERRHPKYKALLCHWNFMEETYNGGRKWFDSNIFRYIKEGDKEFSNRIARAYRFNHTREVVDLINKYLFKQAITRNEVDAPKCVLDFWKSATKGNLTINDFVRQVSKKTSLFGRVAIVVDKTGADQEIVTRQDEIEANLHTYGYIVEPQRILDYSYDENGELNWILIHEIGRDDEDPFLSSGKQVNRYRLWTKNNWLLLEVKEGKGKKNYEVTEVERGEHKLGEVPVILADNIIGDDQYSAPALIDDIAYLDRATANYLSNLDAIIQDQTFSQLAMPAQNLMPGEEQYDKLLEMGTKRVFLYDGENGTSPFYLSPDVKQADLLMTTINKIIGEIYHTVGLAGERTKQDNAVGIDNSSGVAKAYDFERVNALLTAKADSLETIENKIVRLVAKWNGATIDDKDSYVSYPDNFDTRGLYDEFDISARLMLIEAPETVRRTQMEAVINKLFPQLAKELRKKMIDELKDWPIDPLELAAQITDGNSTGQLKNRTSIKKNADDAKDATEAKAKNPQGNSAAKATKNNRQGQVTKQTK
ncbi:hypothetical protein ACN1NW_000400 [Acinetobacter baumannii]|nr:hypothetical protein [Acinetobacter baumannii]ELA7030989.1 hypothetical protein [Acinetobacter baumannii]ELA7118752.1 hypothetical protein [Acinetobacter baumannii]ELB0919701.1 hypothetical protein [Acinetobacter baumannii]ELB0965877.1 hypothetical protein [Acinetobacter baumannii]